MSVDVLHETGATEKRTTEPNPSNPHDSNNDVEVGTVGKVMHEEGGTRDVLRGNDKTQKDRTKNSNEDSEKLGKPGIVVRLAHHVRVDDLEDVSEPQGGDRRCHEKIRRVRRRQTERMHVVLIYEELADALDFAGLLHERTGPLQIGTVIGINNHVVALVCIGRKNLLDNAVGFGGIHVGIWGCDDSNLVSFYCRACKVAHVRLLPVLRLAVYDSGVGIRSIALAGFRHTIRCHSVFVTGFRVHDPVKSEVGTGWVYIRTKCFAGMHAPEKRAEVIGCVQ